ncbi:MAG TPA: peptide-methionine (S)-S-oxide reductase MsrA [Salinisphaeraceae bacterium]|nr:peptide-methionine (S)-S-oxide reductase MsrA [Salinisphaeraceae bacterium]
MATATFAMGCFWGPENVFRDTAGVTDVAVGYSGGQVANPSYEQVCSGTTGHAEVVQVEFDPAVISYAALLDVFWANHDPTTRDRQGPDVGRQYRSAIFVHGEDQRAAAEASRERQQAQLAAPIVTEIETLDAFYRAEEYHQRYLQKRNAAAQA